MEPAVSPQVQATLDAMLAPPARVRRPRPRAGTWANPRKLGVDQDRCRTCKAEDFWSNWFDADGNGATYVAGGAEVRWLTLCQSCGDFYI